MLSLRVRNFSIPTRLRIVFTVVIALMLFGSLVSFWHLRNVSTYVQHTSRAETRLASVLRLSNTHLNVTNQLLRVAEEQESQRYLAVSRRMDRALQEELRNTAAAVEEIGQDRRYAALSASVATLIESLPRRLVTLAELAEKGNWETLRFRLTSETDQTDEVVNALMKRLEADVVEARAQFNKDLTQAQERATSTLVITTSLSIGIALFLGTVVTRSITTPLERLSHGTRAIAAGELHHRVPADGEDELTELANAFNQMGYDIEALFEEVTHERAVAESAHAALQEQTQALARANADLQQFAYSASHDLQEPLRTISLYTQLLRRRSRQELGSEGLQVIEVISQSSVHMQQLISDLLAYTRAGHLDREAPAPVDVNVVVEKVLSLVRGSMVDHGCRITTDNLPVVRVHETHLQQVLQNLISNAMKYRSPERAPEIHLWAERHGMFWQICVRDNGIGIAPEYTDKIFGVFKRLHGKQYSGTGIGLAICQRIIEGYGGKIWVDSKVGGGSTFRFTLPAASSE